MSRGAGLIEVDWNVVAGAQNLPTISHFDPTATRGSHKHATAPEPVCSGTTFPEASVPHLHHYPPSSASQHDRLATRQRSFRRPSSATAQGMMKPFSPVGGVSQSFAAPLRPMSLQEFQDALKKIMVDDHAVEERVRTLTLHLTPDVFEMVEPIRLQSKSAKHFVDLVLKLKKHRSIRQGFGLTLEEFKVRLQRDIIGNECCNTDESVGNLIDALGPQTKAEVREKFVFRSSMEDFVKQLDMIQLPSDKTIAFSRQYLASVIDSLCDLDGSVPHTPLFDLVQNEVTPKMRYILSEWLFDVSIRFKFCQETTFLALALMDRYLMIQRITRPEAQLVGIAALVLAAKYEEVYPPEIKDFAYMAADAFGNGDIIRMERQIFVRLQFGVTVATVNAVATSLLGEQDPRPSSLQAMVVYYLCILVVLATHLGQHSQAQLAAAVVYVSRIWFEIPTDSPAHEVQKLVPVVVNLLASISPSSRPGQTVYNYFALPEQMFVSTLPVPSTVMALTSSTGVSGPASPVSSTN